MRNILSIVTLIPTLLFAQTPWGGTASTTWYVGNETAATYEISSAEGLAGLAELVNAGTQLFVGKTIKLTADINLNNKEWVPIGTSETGKYFGGVFDGQGYTVSGLSINSTDDYQGLFGYTEEAKVVGLGVKGSVKGGSNVGGILGSGNTNVHISNSYFVGTVTGTGNVGGIVGSIKGEIFNSYVIGTVTGTTSIGGIVGNGLTATIANKFTNCWFMGTATSGGIRGSGSGTITNCYTNNSNVGGGTSRTLDSMKVKRFSNMLNIRAATENNTASNNYAMWVYNADTLPTLSTVKASIASYFDSGLGTSASPYIIKEKKHLEHLSELTIAGKNFSGEFIKMEANIVLNDTNNNGGWRNWGISSYGLSQWTPIGTNVSGGSSFNGNFDGNGKVITGLYIKTTNSYQGLFGLIDGSNRISNLGLEGFYIENPNSSSYVGSIVGYGSLNTHVRNSYAIGNLIGSSNSIARNISYTNCYFAGKISVPDYNFSGTNSFFNSDSVTSTTGIPKTTTELKDTAFFDLLQIYASSQNNTASNNYVSWKYNPGGYPTLTDSRATLDMPSYFNSGTGSQGNPYIIMNKYQLRNFSALVRSGNNFSGLHVKLGANIELNDTTKQNGWRSWDSTTTGLEQWEPIGNSSNIFSGTFDGNGKVISGLYINRTTGNQGLFGSLGDNSSSAVISNLGLEGFYVKGGTYVGSIVGNAGNTTGNNVALITDSYAIGNLTGTVVGGIVGSGGTVRNSYFIGTVTGTSQNVGGNVGGITGGSGLVINSYVIGNVSGTTYVGGILGSNIALGSGVTNSYFSGNITGSSYVGGIATGGNATNSFYDIDLISSGATLNSCGTALSTTEMQTMLPNYLNIYAGTQNGKSTSNNYWGWESNENGYPTLSGTKANLNTASYFEQGNGTQANPYIITTKNQLENFVSLVNSGNNFSGLFVKLGNNIALNSLEQWTPIGNNPNSFAGNFDGGGKIISGLYINNAKDFQGLFGNASTGFRVSNLGLENLNVKGNSYVGGIIGYSNASAAIIENSYVIGKVEGTGGIGGISGYQGTITNSYFVGTVTGTSNTGAIRGSGSGTITGTFHESNLTGSTSTAEMKDIRTYMATNWNFSTIWTVPHNSYPIFQSQIQNAKPITNASYTLENQRLTSAGNPTTIELFEAGVAKNPVVKSASYEETALTNNSDYYVLHRNNINIGSTAEILLIGTGEYVGVKTIPFYITAPRNFSNATIDEIPEQVGINAQPKPIIRDFNGTVILREDEDYFVDYENNNKEGTAKVTIIGWNIYDGQGTETTFQIVSNKSLTKKTTLAITTPETYTYTGHQITPDVTVTHADDGVLILNKDYIVEYANNINAGTATITITGIGDYSGILTTNFTIEKKTLDRDLLIPIPQQEYTGQSIIPLVSLLYGEIFLELNKDYIITQRINNINVTTTNPARIIIAAASPGNYTGSLTAEFSIAANIVKTDIAVDWGSLNLTYTGEEQKPTASATYPDGTPMLLIINGAQTNASETPYTATATLAVANPAYKLTPGSVEFHINKAPINATLQIPDVKSGLTIAKNITGVKEDAKVTYLYSTDIGTGYGEKEPAEIGSYYAKAAIAETTNYLGAETEPVLFVITKSDVTPIAVAWENQTSFEYNGMEQAPKATATLGNRSFELIISTATNAGNKLIATARLANPTGEYALTNNTKEFSITRKPLPQNAIDPIGNFYFAGLPIKPDIIVRDNTGILAEKVDYTVEYGDNILGLGSVKITGIGNYSGTSERFFAISLPTARIINVAWDNKTSFEYNGSVQTPTASATDSGIKVNLDILGEHANAGNYTAVAALTEPDPYVILANSVRPYIIAEKKLTVKWDEQREFVYNKMVQYPKASVKDGETNIPLHISGTQSAAGTHSIMAIIENEITRKNYILQNNAISYTINKKDLKPYFTAIFPQDFASSTDTLWVDHSVFSDSTLLHTALLNSIDYDGFATNDRNESDDAAVLKGQPTIALQYTPFSLGKRVETTQKATATIATENMSADNYVPLNRPIVIMATVVEADNAPKMFCRVNNHCVEFTEAVCLAVSGVVVETCAIKVNCVINEVCVENTDIESCNLLGKQVESCNMQAPIMSHVQHPMSHAPTYYNLKGHPLGMQKPTTPGIYIEKSGKNVRKIFVK